MGRLAVDIGGTFTDLVYFDGDSDELVVEKALTTPRDLTEGVQKTIGLAEVVPEATSFFVHGGTTVINAITERKGAVTALVTTAGFRDVLEIARGNRPDLYNFCFEKPRPFVPRRLRFEVRERVRAPGEVLAPLRLEDLDPVIEQCRAEGVEAIAVQFLHSYAAPEHESVCAAYLRERLPGVAVTASHEITREWREYERANTAILNAYVQPIVQRYFDTLETGLGRRGVRCPYAAMQSNGGTTSFAWAREHPITLIESGPAAGVGGAALAGKLARAEDVIYLDIGGTTAKCSVIEGGEPKVHTEYKLEWTRINPGYPVKIPVVDIVEIGAGGGSIAWFNATGALQVGPASAGADPGPACYARGGAQPTVTDAMLLAGVLNPDYFAGGRLRLDAGRAVRAMEQVAAVLRTGIDEAAVGVLRLVEANMINALKLVSIQRGHDPRDFVLIAAGGGGPVHAASLGRELGVREILIPRYPGYFSAWGMLVTEPRRDFVQTALIRASEITTQTIHELFQGLRAEAENYFRSDPTLPSDACAFECRIDLRYFGQEHWVTVPVKLEGVSVERILVDFHAAHQRAYTFRLDDTPVEFVNFRLKATARAPRPELRALDGPDRSAEDAAKGRRQVNFSEEGWHEADVFERDRLPAGFSADGPLIVEERSSTTLVLPGQRLRVDDLGFLRITEV